MSQALPILILAFADEMRSVPAPTQERAPISTLG